MQLTFLRPWAPQILSFIRILTALSFMSHGLMKLAGWPAPFPYPMNGLLYVAAVLEVVGGVLLVLGLFSRPVAFLLSGEMAVAYFMAHASQGFFPVLNMGEAAMLYCFIFLYIAAAGPGPWSLDAMQKRD